MKKTELQIFLGERITKSKLPKEAKLQILNYVQNEADIHQLMLLALDGKITAINNDDTKKIIEDRFNASKLSEVGVMAATAGFVAGSIIVKKIKFLRRRFLACKVTCSNTRGVVKQECLEKCKTSFKAKMKAARMAGKKDK
jgi:hypothetical protein